MTNEQIKLIHVAAKQAGLVDAQYRTLLKCAGGVDSCKQLSNAAFEDVMAVLEDLGFTAKDGVKSVYWRNKVQARGQQANPRMVHKIHALANDSRYELGALCLRFSEHRTEEPELLYPREAWNLIEMLKASNEREGG